ncbi:zinc ribbon domain-containing protein [Streptomyces phaeofaciens JCM 4814]|uniref:Zinc ribbon domain-containing protein n=1 Tax=Streptomyces phaeofaciens TaxID=68254 RepID=A0A918HMC8_9ACTN|nr:zinc ribbon domain-containing protein [Streptomyces phaeofaciens]GGT75263.1 zinc ribbon domain-containing protein [Streptomyces phaeofaciens]
MTTQNCADCGTRAEPGQSFCDACGAVLSWTDRATVRAGAAASTSGATATPGTPGAGEGSATGSGSGSGDDVQRPEAGAADTSRPGSGAPSPAPRPSRDTDPPEPAVTAPAPASSAVSASAVDDEHDPDDEDTTETPLPALPPDTADDSRAATTPAPALGDTMAARARSLLVPVDEPEAPAPAAPPTVAPVLPGRPVADRPQVRVPVPERGEENGVACPWCSTPNRPDRHFCTRCAMPMTLEDRSPQRLPWWRRVLNRDGQAHWAGDRPRLRRTFDRIVTWVVAALVLTLLIWVGMNASGWVQATRDHFAKRAPVAPDAYAASRSYPGHKPELAFDKYANTWWGPGVSESGEGEWIEARFDEPTRLLDVIITSGTSSKADQLNQSALPHRLKATITTKDGKTTTRELVLDQSAGGQRRAFRVGEVTKVRFTVESSYGASGSKQVAIAEIEFFGKSSANAS